MREPVGPRWRVAILRTPDRTARLHARAAVEEVRRCGGMAVDVTDTDQAVDLGPEGRFDVVLIVCGRYPPFELVERLDGAPVVIDPSPVPEPLCDRLDRAVVATAHHVDRSCAPVPEVTPPR